MYPRPSAPPQLPSHSNSDNEYDQYPLNETNFVERQPVMQSPFSDPYPPLESSYHVETHEPRMPIYDSQPLLSSNNTISMPMPDNRYSNIPNEQYNNDNDASFFTGAPRRQPRRYKTSKHILTFMSKCFIILISIFIM